MSTVDCCCSSMSCVRPKTNWKKIHPWAANVWEAIVFRKSPLAKRSVLSAKWLFFKNQHANLCATRVHLMSYHFMTWWLVLAQISAEAKIPVLPGHAKWKVAEVWYGHMVTYHIVSYLVSYLTSHHGISDHISDEIKSLDSDIPWNVERCVLLFSCSSEISTPFLWNRVWVLVRTTLCTSRTPYGIAPKCTVYRLFSMKLSYKKKDKRQFSCEPCRKVLRHQNMVKSGAKKKSKFSRCAANTEVWKLVWAGNRPVSPPLKGSQLGATHL